MNRVMIPILSIILTGDVSQKECEYIQSWRLPEELVTTKIDWASMKLSNLDNQLYSSRTIEYPNTVNMN